jgi:hypothetical protein
MLCGAFCICSRLLVFDICGGGRLLCGGCVGCLSGGLLAVSAAWSLSFEGRLHWCDTNATLVNHMGGEGVELLASQCF